MTVTVHKAEQARKKRAKAGAVPGATEGRWAPLCACAVSMGGPRTTTNGSGRARWRQPMGGGGGAVGRLDMAAARSEAEEAAGGDGGPPAPAAPGRAQVFATVVDTFLEKLVAAGSYQRFANCYRCFYKLQPEMTRSIYDQFISQLQTSIKEEIQEVKNEGNLEVLFNSLDKIVEEAKNQEEPAWYGQSCGRQSGERVCVEACSFKGESHVPMLPQCKEEVSAAETRGEVNSVLNNSKG
ncbi:polyamine-modulated factor 1 isoform X2 [Calonectris borealis]|uniref:polyamine-modulated factor 1 isoform X2 n=1 Tax=Calonectris borealis TaxID=1323832 RepID=UPI003F4C35A9